MGLLLGWSKKNLVELISQHGNLFSDTREVVISGTNNWENSSEMTQVSLNENYVSIIKLLQISGIEYFAFVEG